MADKKRILIVEDERLIAEDIKNTLESLGYSVVDIVSKGETAINVTEKELPDLILMDIVIKGDLNGIETAGRIRARFQIPIVYLTAYADKKTLEQAKVTEPFGYIIKPFEDKELHSVIEMALYKIQMEKRLTRLNNLLHSLRNVNQLITKEKDLDLLIQGVCDNLIEKHDYNYAWIVLLDDSKNIVKYAKAGLDRNFMPIIDSINKSKFPYCAKNALTKKGVFIIEDVNACEGCNVAENLSGYGAFVVKLELEDILFGVLCVSIPPGLLIDDEELSLFNEVAEDLSFALHNIQLREQRKCEQEELLRLSSAVKTSIDSIIISDKDSKIIDVNEAALKMYGFENKDDIIGKRSLDFIAPEDQDKAYEGIDECLERGYQDSHEFNLVVKDGNKIPVEITTTIMKELDGEAVGFVDIVRDITDRKHANEALRESEHRYRSFVQNFPGIAFRTDMKLQPIFLHGSVKKITGYSEKQLVNGNPKLEQIIYPPDLPKYKNSLDMMFVNPADPRELEFRILHKKGKLCWVNGIFQYSCDEKDMPISVQGTLYDITKRKQAEVELKESEEKSRTIFNNATDGILLANIETKKIFTGNDTICQMLGYSLKELQELLIVNVHPKTEMLKVAEKFDQQVKRKISIENDIPIQRKDGSIFYADINSSPITIGGKKYLMSIYRDITERKQNEELLKERARAELYGFLVSALPVFASNVPTNVRNILVSSFAERFENNIRPKFTLDKEKYKKDNSSGNELEFYLTWISELFDNFGIKAKPHIKPTYGDLKFLNCPWITEARGNPIFCLICRVIVLRSFNWTSLEGNITQNSSIANHSKTCRFEIHITNNDNN